MFLHVPYKLILHPVVLIFHCDKNHSTTTLGPLRHEKPRVTYFFHHPCVTFRDLAESLLPKLLRFL